MRGEVTKFAFATGAILVAALFSGCVGYNDDGELAFDSSKGFFSAGASHGKPSVDESDAKTSLRGVNYIPPFVSTKTITIANDFGGALNCAISIQNCGIHFQPWEDSGYKFVIMLEAGGYTPYDAEANLNEIQVKNTDSVSDGVLFLGVAVDYHRDNQIIGIGDYRYAKIDAYLPPKASYGLDAGASGGEIVVEGMHGGRFSLDTSGGSIAIKNVDLDVLSAKSSGGSIFIDEIKCGEVSLESSGGSVSGEVISNLVDIETSGGSIDVKIESAKSGRYDISSSGGSVSVYVKAGGKYGYDVSAETSGGEITINLSNCERVDDYDDDSEAHYRTRNYNSKNIQVQMEVETSGGSIFVGEFG